MASVATAQQVSGTVKDTQRKGIDKVTVSLLWEKDSSILKLGVTGQNGKYSFGISQNGKYLISASHAGFEPVYSSPFEVSGSGEVAIPDMVIEKTTGNLSNVTVTSKKPMVEVKADKTILNVEGTINATGTDALGLLRKSPGVLVDKDDNLSLAGKNGVKVYIDGKPTPLAGADLAKNRAGVPFLATLPLAFIVPAVVGAVAERLLYRPMYQRPHLDHVLFSIGLVFMTVAAVDYFVGSSQQIVKLPAWLQGRFEIEGVGIGKYRLFIVGVCLVLTLLLQWVLGRTRFGSRLRAAVDDPRVAAGLGIPVNRVFLATFAVGSGLAGLGGALGADILGLDPTFPLKFMVYFLIVCAVGGTSSITGPLVAALVLGIADVMGKYYAPKLGAFIVYVLMIAILLWRPQGLFTREGRK